MDQLNELLGGIIIVGGTIALVYIVARYNYLIKKMMIEKGMKVEKNNQTRLIETGCVLFFVGVGALITSRYSSMNLLEDTKELLTWGTILISGGLGLGLAQWVRNRFGN